MKSRLYTVNYTPAALSSVGRNEATVTPGTGRATFLHVALILYVAASRAASRPVEQPKVEYDKFKNTPTAAGTRLTGSHAARVRGQRSEVSAVGATGEPATDHHGRRKTVH